MNTTHIKSFLYVSQYNSISKAADRLNYSTSTIYEHLKALEHEVGVNLYNSTNSGINLTENGEIFLEYATKILDIDDIHNTFYQSGNRLRISASESSDFFVMKPLMEKFMTKYPDVEIDYTKRLTEASVDKLLRNLIDMAVISEPSFTTSKLKCDFLCKLPYCNSSQLIFSCFFKTLSDCQIQGFLSYPGSHIVCV